MWGYKKGISLTPRTNESKIIAFADSMRRQYIVNKTDCISIHGETKKLFKKYNFVTIAEKRKKKLLDFLIKHGMDYENLLTYI